MMKDDDDEEDGDNEAQAQDQHQESRGNMLKTGIQLHAKVYI